MFLRKDSPLLYLVEEYLKAQSHLLLEGFPRCTNFEDFTRHHAKHEYNELLRKALRDDLRAFFIEQTNQEAKD